MVSKTLASGWDVPGSLLEVDGWAGVPKNGKRVRQPRVAVAGDHRRKVGVT
jgi:hypothetical protein